MTGKIISHYRLLEKLGQGGMGVVYKSEDTRLKRPVALKFLPAELTRDEEAKQRFLREAQTASLLDHPNICTIHEIEETGEGQIFIVMAYYEGETLATNIKQQNTGSKKSLDWCIDIAVQMAQGLAKAHAHGIVHRDLKPANVMITREGVIKILDFGLAKLAGQTRLTKTGVTIGTMAYMSPEQAQGMDADHRSDIWALGVVLYEMLTGQLPFKGEYEQVAVYAILNEDPQPLTDLCPDTPEAVARIVSNALCKRPDERYQRIDDMLDDLLALKGKIAVEPERLRPGERARSRRRYRYGGLAALLVISIALLFFLWQRAEKRNAATIPDQYRIAVLPLANISRDSQDEYFAEGMTEELISTLSKIGHFRVIARTSIMRYKSGEKDIAAIGRELKVGTILEGSVRKADGKLRITAKLIDARRQVPLWTHDYDRELQDVFAIQSDIAHRVAEALQAELPAREKHRIEKKATENFSAYLLYLKGRFFWNKRTTEGLKKGMAYFQQALAKDSTYALAHVGMADSYAILGTVEYGGLRAPEAIAKAKAALERAIAFDDQCAEAYAALGNIRYTYEWDWRKAENELARAITLNPNYALAHHYYAHFLTTQGRLEQALSEIKLAQELDPLSLIISTTVGMVLYYARQPEQAIEQLRKTLEMDTDFVAAQLQLGLVYGQQRRFDEAMAISQKAISIAGKRPMLMALSGYIYAASGDREQALAILTALQKPSPQQSISASHLALIHLGLGDNERVFEWLDKACQERSSYLAYLKVEPLVDSLRDDARFALLLKRVGLEE